MSFRVDDFKREYKNQPQGQVKSWLQEHFDPEQASIYLAVYKEDDIPGVDFVRSNKFNGYYQQMDNKLHSKAFGIGVYHEGQMEYLWIFGEKEIPPLMKDSPLYEVCDWVPLSLNNEKIWSLVYPESDETYLYL